ncbi:MAG TPA: PQQ-binding-like beta-propeller repeat protein [Thermoguttaceae bacterium]|nr:PQQ-binding-like beta-propeller repeat protein [Thermoguttaceae bacterium]
MKRTTLFLTTLLTLLPATSTPADDWPQWRGPTRDGVWRESGIIEKFDGPVIQRRWTAEIAGGYSGPTVAEGRVYVTDRLTEPRQIERVLCFDARTGERIWAHAYDCEYRISYRAGPRASVTVDDGRAYALGSMGHFCCLDAATGEVLWQKDPQADFKARVPTWGVSAAPLVEGELVILQIGGADGACVVALDRETGVRRWAALDDPPSYSAPIVIDQAGRRVLVVWTGIRMVGLDAQTGELYWQHEVGYTRWVIGIASPVRHQDRLLISAVDKGSLMLRLLPDRPGIEKLWWRFGSPEETDALQSLMCTPYLADGYVYGVNGEGLMRCLDADSGDRIWHDDTATSQVRWGTLHMVRNGDRIWMFNDRGELIISRLSPQGFEEISRARLIGPTRLQLNRGDGVTWSHPAFALKHVFIRNDEELVCASLAAEERNETQITTD